MIASRARTVSSRLSTAMLSISHRFDRIVVATLLELVAEEQDLFLCRFQEGHQPAHAIGLVDAGLRHIDRCRPVFIITSIEGPPWCRGFPSGGHCPIASVNARRNRCIPRLVVQATLLVSRTVDPAPDPRSPCPASGTGQIHPKQRRPQSSPPASAMWASSRQIRARMITEPTKANQKGPVTPHLPAIAPPKAAPTTSPP